MNQKPGIQSESIFSLILAALGAFIIIVSLTIGFGTLKTPGSGLFPFLVGLLIFVQSMTVFFMQKPAAEKGLFDRNETRNFFLMIAVFCLWIILMPYLGYVVVTFIVVLAFSKILKLEGWFKPIILSIVTMGLCYLLFDLLMYLDLPRGFLG
jgi:putative tricarboxylic transport membrane protein